MSTNSVTNPTMLDYLRRSDANGKLLPVIDILNQTNEVIEDATVVPCSEGQTHLTTIRSGLPSATWRKLNYGVQPSKSTTVQVRDTCGMLEAYAEVDAKMVHMSRARRGEQGAADYLMSENEPFMESMSQNVASTIFYGDTDVNPERFMGVMPRFDLTTAENGFNIINGGGVGSDNQSALLVGWSPTTCHLIVPDDAAAGFTMTAKGQETAVDSSGNMREVFRTHYKWEVGMTVRDWRYVVRIANIDTSELTKTGSTGADLQDLMIQASERIPVLSRARMAFYVTRRVREYLRRQMIAKSNHWLTDETIAGKRVTMFSGIPVRRCDALLETEATIA